MGPKRGGLKLNPPVAGLIRILILFPDVFFFTKSFITSFKWSDDIILGSSGNLYSDCLTKSSSCIFYIDKSMLER